MEIARRLFRRRFVDDLRSAEEKRSYVFAIIASAIGWSFFSRTPHVIELVFGMWAFRYVLHGLSLARTRADSIRVTSAQFPEIHSLLIQFSEKLGLNRVPEVYVMKRPDLMNAFATRFVTRDYVVLYSDLIEMAYENDLSALGFILAHELGHVALRHVQRNSWVSLSNFIPFVHEVHSRGCEMSADCVGAYLMPGGALSGMCSLGTGRSYLASINPRSYAAQHQAPRSIAESIAGMVATHPFVPQRLTYLERQVGETER